MRGAFGFVGLLIAVAIGAYLWANSAKQSTDTGRQMEKQVNQIAGRDATTGGRADESLITEPESPGGHLRDLVVKDVGAGNQLHDFYGLEKGDQIVTVDQMDVRNMSDDAGMAKDLLLKAYQEQKPLIVLRNGQQVTLPQAAKPAAAAQAAQSPGTPAPAGTQQQPTPTAPPPPAAQRQTIYDQVNKIPGVQRDPQQ